MKNESDLDGWLSSQAKVKGHKKWTNGHISQTITLTDIIPDTKVQYNKRYLMTSLFGLDLRLRSQTWRCLLSVNASWFFFFFNFFLSWVWDTFELTTQFLARPFILYNMIYMYMHEGWNILLWISNKIKENLSFPNIYLNPFLPRSLFSIIWYPVFKLSFIFYPGFHKKYVINWITIQDRVSCVGFLWKMYAWHAKKYVMIL